MVGIHVESGKQLALQAKSKSPCVGLPLHAIATTFVDLACDFGYRRAAFGPKQVLLVAAHKHGVPCPGGTWAFEIPLAVRCATIALRRTSQHRLIHQGARTASPAKILSSMQMLLQSWRYETLKTPKDEPNDFSKVKVICEVSREWEGMQQSKTDGDAQHFLTRTAHATVRPDVSDMPMKLPEELADFRI